MKLKFLTAMAMPLLYFFTKGEPLVLPFMAPTAKWLLNWSSKPVRQELRVFESRSPEKLCVRWSPDTTIGSLSKALMKLGGAGYPVLLRKRGLLAKLAFWRRNNLSLETPLSSLGKASLEAIVVVRATVFLHIQVTCRAARG